MAKLARDEPWFDWLSRYIPGYGLGGWGVGGVGRVGLLHLTQRVSCVCWGYRYRGIEMGIGTSKLGFFSQGLFSAQTHVWVEGCEGDCQELGSL